MDAALTTTDLNQNLNGSSGNDVLTGGSGNDRIFGGAGSDTMNGGAGSDSLNAGSGSDVLIYNVTANAAAGTTDVYMGGSGKDTIVLEFTRAQWLLTQTQTQIASYLTHLANVTNATTGEVSNGLASDFVFTFGSSKLTVQMMESIRIFVDGVELSATNDAVTAGADTGTTTEDGPAVDLFILANDVAADLVSTVALTTGPLHGSAVLVIPPATPNVPSTWYFRYEPVSSFYQFLAVGETAFDSFTYTVTDANGDTATATATITITGSNDAPTISAAVATGAVTEDNATPSLTAAGTITFDDVDLTDSHSASVVASGTNTLGGVLTAAVSDTATGAGDGTLSWSYSVATAATQFLAAGQTATESFDVTIDDGHTGTVTQTITVTVTGTNDAPTISAAVSTGAVTEDSADPLTALGTITFDDVDLSDTHTTAVLASVTNTLGGILTATVSDTATGAGNGTVSWSYSVANAATQFLAAGQTATESFDVTIDDGHTGTVTQTVTVTVTGTNDAPTISVAVSTGAVTEDSGDPLTAVGTITFDDVDLTDTHTTSVLASATNTLGGVLTATVSNTATGAGDGTISWSYSVANAATQSVAAGETVTESFDVTISDGHSGSVTQTVTITVTGTNDAPTISAAVATGAVTEDSANPNLTAIGTITFDDVDLIDTHSTSVLTSAANTLGGILTATVSDTATGAGNGTVSWSYSVANAATQFLAAGQTRTESFDVTIDDGHTGSVTQTITVTVTGSNDAPTINAAVAATGAVTEDSTTPTLTAVGTFTFDDADLTDSHTTSVLASGTNTLGGVLTATITDTATGAGDGTVSWSYSIANAATQSVAAGQTVTESFDVTISDGHTDSVTQSVTITVTGTNDAPDIQVVTSDSAAKTLTETDAGLTATGTLTVTDVDLTDTVASAVTSVTLGGTTGSLTAAAVLGFFTVSPAAGLAANTGDANNLTWNFDSTTEAFDYLDAGQSLTLTYTVQASDGQGGTDTQQVTITINGTNDNEDPVAAADRIIVSTNTLVTIATSALLANDTDIDGLALTITSVSGATGITGLAVNTANGTISFTSGATAGAAAGSFQYTVSDGAAGTTTSTVTIDVRAVGAGADTINLSAAGAYQASYLDGGAGADIFTGNAAGDVFLGGAGADALTGSAGNDLLIGGDNNDTLAGEAGNDTLRGGIGNNDSMDGGAGNEDLLDFSDGTTGITFTLVQGAASTPIANGTGSLGNNDSYQNMEGVIGTSLADTITGSGSNDIIRGGGGNDDLNGAGGIDLLDFSDATAAIVFTLVQSATNTAFAAAGLGTDTYKNFEGVVGTIFADSLTGSASADTLRGGAGNDTISGLAGNDRIQGGDGADTLTGGTGAGSLDTFVFDTARNAVDTITDFDANAADKIELSKTVFAALTTATGSPLAAAEFVSLNGTGASDSVAAGVHVIYDSASNNLYYDADAGTSANRTLIVTLPGLVGVFDQNDIAVGI
jgi:large repetitive protein